LSEVAPETRGIAVATPCPPCPPCTKCSKGPSLVSRVGRQVLRVLHDRPVRTELKKLLPILVLRAIVYAGGSVETAKLVEHALKTAGL